MDYLGKISNPKYDLSVFNAVFYLMTFNLILKSVVKINKNAKFLGVPIIEKCVEKALLPTNGLIMVNTAFLISFQKADNKI